MMMMMDQIHETYRGGERGGCGRILGQCKGPILTEMMTVMTMMMTVMMTDQVHGTYRGGGLGCGCILGQSKAVFQKRWWWWWWWWLSAQRWTTPLTDTPSIQPPHPHPFPFKSFLQNTYSFIFCWAIFLLFAISLTTLLCHEHDLYMDTADPSKGLIIIIIITTIINISMCLSLELPLCKQI